MLFTAFSKLGFRIKKYVQMRVAIVLFLFFFALQTNAQAPVVDDLGYRKDSIKGLSKPSNALNFLVLGDWGRNGENYQKEVAEGMGKAAHDIGARFIIATGDNFYPNGVASTRDHHWLVSFENIYTAQSLHFPWYPVLGNHDYLTNAQAQVDYSELSSRWRMTSRYYAHTFNVPGQQKLKAKFIFIDTDPIEKQMRGEKNPARYPEGGVEKQMTWLKEQLADTTCHYKIVVGHHPLYTGGWRRNTDDTRRMRELLEPLFLKHKVNAYIAGHEHHLEHTKPAGFTHHFISGAGSEARAVEKHPEGGVFAAGQQGFAVFSLSEKTMTVQFINHKEEVIYKNEIRW